MLLTAGAVSALVWANSPWSTSYEDLWTSRAAITVAGHNLDLDLRHWINDGLMTIFFFVVGLEIKRELTDGHLSGRRAALLPTELALTDPVEQSNAKLAILLASALAAATSTAILLSRGRPGNGQLR